LEDLDATTTEEVEPVTPKVIVKKVEPPRKECKHLTILQLFSLLKDDIGEELLWQAREELMNRKLMSFSLNELIRGWISEYNPKKMNEAQLRDDWRIVLGWYSSLKEGRKLYKHKGDQSVEISEQDCKDLILIIFREMVARGIKFNSPDTYKSHAKELFLWVIKQVGRDTVPWKGDLAEIANPNVEYWPETYDATSKLNKILIKDWNRFFKLYVNIDKGKKYFVKKGDTVTEITEEAVKDRTLLVFKELIARKRKFSMRAYKGTSKKLFDWLVAQVGADKVPFKEVKEGEHYKHLPFNPGHITKADLPNIDPVATKIMSDEELYYVHNQLHRMETVTEGVPDEVAQAHKYIVAEMKHRGIEHVTKEGMLDKLRLEPAEIDRSQLESVDGPYVETLTDKELEELHKRLHELLKEIGKVTEPLANAHIFVWKEMQKRKLKHSIDDTLDRVTTLPVVEYPQPEFGPSRGVPQEMSDKEIKLEDVISSMPDTILIDDPIHVYLCGRVVNERKIPPDHDIDLLFKQPWPHVPTVRSVLAEISETNPEVAKRLHFVWDVQGPQIGMTVPLYRLAFVKVDQSEMKRNSPFEFLSAKQAELFKPYIALKPRSGFHKNEFFDPQEMWDKWGSKYIDKGIMIQKKYDGMRITVHVQGDKVAMYTEDQRRDRVACFKKSVEELLKGKKVESCILDTEMVEYGCGSVRTNDPELVCKQKPREEQIKWIAAKPEGLDDEDVVFHIHDCTFLDGKGINEEGYLQRWEAINKVLGKAHKHWKRVPGTVVHDMRGFFTQVKRYRSLNDSEGVVCKTIDSVYPIKYTGENRASDWAKLKNLKEIDVMVVRVSQKKTSEGKMLNEYLYDCVFQIPCGEAGKYRSKDLIKHNGKCYLEIGTTYATAEHVPVGTIIVVRPIRIAEVKDKESKIYYTWMFPLYEGKHAAKTEPDTVDTVKKIAAEGTSPGAKAAKLSKMVISLSSCPFWFDSNVCPLRDRFRMPRDQLSKNEVSFEYLKYPIVCKFANQYKCRFVKPYYYGYKTVQEKGEEVDENSGAEIEPISKSEYKGQEILETAEGFWIYKNGKKVGKFSTPFDSAAEAREYIDDRPEEFKSG